MQYIQPLAHEAQKPIGLQPACQNQAMSTQDWMIKSLQARLASVEETDNFIIVHEKMYVRLSMLVASYSVSLTKGQEMGVF